MLQDEFQHSNNQSRLKSLVWFTPATLQIRSWQAYGELSNISFCRYSICNQLLLLRQELGNQQSSHNAFSNPKKVLPHLPPTAQNIVSLRRGTAFCTTLWAFPPTNMQIRYGTPCIYYTPTIHFFYNILVLEVQSVFRNHPILGNSMIKSNTHIFDGTHLIALISHWGQKWWCRRDHKIPKISSHRWGGDIYVVYSRSPCLIPHS